MNDQKKTYYISVGPGEILTTPSASPWQFKIEANDEEITKLRAIFDSSQVNSIGDFFRAHVPYVEYSNDSTNDQHDSNLYRVYHMIYELGDQEARDHIESMGILDGFRSE
ncbi:hydrolase [Siminovitchia sediminis]|uniref:Hydrolase n=1 Tax=Siminovitchia sediminis TaxID=1274353 RepID=A0ABW4KHC3_9BACI